VPNLLRHDGWRFFFYSNEGLPRETPHVHVRSPAGEAKFWLEPEVALADSQGLDARTLRALSAVVDRHRADFLRSWHDYFA
jgi:hypothetical protein